MGRNKLLAQRARVPEEVNEQEEHNYAEHMAIEQVQQREAEDQAGASNVYDNDDTRSGTNDPSGEELKNIDSNNQEIRPHHTPDEDAEDMLLANTAQAEKAISRLSLTPPHRGSQGEQEGSSSAEQPGVDDDNPSSDSVEIITGNERAAGPIGATVTNSPPNVPTAVEENGSNEAHQAPCGTAQDDSPTRLYQMRRQQQEQLGVAMNRTAARNQPNTGLPSGSSMLTNPEASRTEAPANNITSSQPVVNTALANNQGPSRQAVRAIAPRISATNPPTHPPPPNTAQAHNPGPRNRMQGHGNPTGRPLPQYIQDVAESMELEYTEALDIREAAFHQRMGLINPTLREDQYELWYNQELGIYNRTVAAIRTRVQRMLETMARNALPHDPEGRVRIEQQRALMEAQRQRDLAIQREQLFEQQRWNALNAQQVRGRQRMDQQYLQHRQQQQQQQHQGQAPYPQFQAQQSQPVVYYPGPAPGPQYHPQQHPQMPVLQTQTPIQGQAGHPLQAPQVPPRVQQQSHFQFQALQPPLPSHPQAHPQLQAQGQAQGQAPLLQPQPQHQNQAPQPGPALGSQHSQNPNPPSDLQIFNNIANVNNRASLLSTAITEMERTLEGVRATESRLLADLTPYQRGLFSSWVGSGNAGRRNIALDERIALIRGLERTQGSEGLNTARAPRMLGIAGTVAGVNPTTGFGREVNIGGAGHGGPLPRVGSVQPPHPTPQQANAVNSTAQVQQHPQQASMANTTAELQPHPHQANTANTATQVQQQPVAMEVYSEPTEENEPNKEQELNNEDELSGEKHSASAVPTHKRGRAPNVKSPRGKGGKKQKGSKI